MPLLKSTQIVSISSNTYNTNNKYDYTLRIDSKQQYINTRKKYQSLQINYGTILPLYPSHKNVQSEKIFWNTGNIRTVNKQSY